MTSERIGYHILRLSLASVLLWFGFSQLFNGIEWVGWVPDWVVSFVHLPPAMIVLANGLFEVIAGALIAMNLFVRPVAALVAIHFAFITLEIGMTAIGVRDFGLTGAAAALAFFASKKEN